MESLSDAEYVRYSRQIALPGIGEAGQSAIKKARILIIGVGGLGCPAAIYLAAAGVGTLGLVDSDIVERSNLPRQTLFVQEDVGKQKAEQAALRLKHMYPSCATTSYVERFSSTNSEELLGGYDLVIDGTDNVASTYCINDACIRQDKPFVYGSLHQFQGQVSVFNFQRGDGEFGPTYRCLFPFSATSSVNCSELGILGPVAGVLGLLQAHEAIKIVTKVGPVLSGVLLVVNLLTLDFQKFHFARVEK